MDTITHMLTALGLPPRASEVYLDLLTHGEATARQLATRLSVPRSSLYDYVRPLLARKLVVEKEKNGKAVFAIHDIEELDRQVAKESESLSLLRSEFTRSKATFAKLAPSSTEAKIKFVEGKEGIVALLYEMLWDTKGNIETVWPYEAMLQVLTPEELDLFNRKRIKQGISLKTIWTGVKPSSKHVWKGGDFKVERRHAPKKFSAPMAYSIYGDKVSFFSSVGEYYGFVVHSADFAMLMRAQFSVLWEVSK